MASGKTAYSIVYGFKRFLHREAETFEVVAPGMVLNITAQNIYYIVGAISAAVLTIFLVVVLWRLIRILGRVDKLSEDIENCVGDVSHFLKELRRKAIVSSLALVIEKFIKAKKGRK